MASPGPALSQEAVRPTRGRRVRRVIRRVDAWSVLKFSVAFYLCLFMVLMVAGVILWNLARSAGLVDNIENFIGELFALKRFHFVPGQILRGSALGGLILVVLGTGANVLMAVLYNLISDVFGGIEVAVLEEERAPPSTSVV